MSATVTRLLPGTRSLVALTDSMAATKLVQEELLRSKQTYTAVADRAAVASSTVSNIATGQTRLPRLETIVRILGALGWVITAARRDD
jgi:plasmid maintenance system antidote protein VapI